MGAGVKSTEKFINESKDTGNEGESKYANRNEGGSPT